MSTPQRSKIFFLRNLLINRSCQLFLMGYNVLTILVTSTFFVTLTLSLQAGETVDRLFFRVLLLGVAIFVFLFFVGFWVSNKIVGPIYRMNQHMEALLRGEKVPELRFRSGDQFQKTAETYNQLIRHFETQGRSK